MNRAEIDVIRRVFEVHSGEAFLEIGPWPDSPNDCLELRTTTKESQEYWGALNVSLSLEFAEALGKALLASVRDMRPLAAVGGITKE